MPIFKVVTVFSEMVAGEERCKNYFVDEKHQEDITGSKTVIV